MFCLHRKQKSIIWHISLPLMNSFNKTDAAVFPWRLCFLKALPFLSLLHILFRDSGGWSVHFLLYKFCYNGNNN